MTAAQGLIIIAVLSFNGAMICRYLIRIAQAIEALAEPRFDPSTNPYPADPRARRKAERS